MKSNLGNRTYNFWTKLLFLFILLIISILSSSKIIMALEEKNDQEKEEAISDKIVVNNNRPKIKSIVISFDPAKGDSEITITAVNVSDREDDIINLVCNYKEKPGRDENLCLNYPQNAEVPYENLVCLMKYDSSQKDIIYCRLHDGQAYSGNVVRANISGYPTLSSDIFESIPSDLAEKLKKPSDTKKFKKDKRKGKIEKGSSSNIINKINELEKRIEVIEVIGRIASLEKNLEEVNAKMIKVESEISSIKENQVELEPFSTEEREKTGFSGFHGYLGFGFFSPGSELNQYFGNGVIYQGYVSYFLDRFSIEPRAGVSYFQKTIETESGGEQKLKMIPIEVAFLRDLFKRTYY